MTHLEQERDAASIVEVTNQNNSFTVQVTTGLDQSIYNYPITLRRRLPGSWGAVSVSQRNKPIASQIVGMGDTKYVVFDAVPNGEDIVISGTPLNLSHPMWLVSDQFQVGLQGPVGGRCTIYSSSNLVNWSPIRTNTLLSAQTNLSFEAPARLQFYRVMWVP